MVEKLGVDPATLMGWEAWRYQPSRNGMGLIARIVQSWGRSDSLFAFGRPPGPETATDLLNY
jgi:hypothetical protein